MGVTQTKEAIMTTTTPSFNEFDALEIQPCTVVGHGGMNEELVEPCEPEDAAFWTVYGHFRTGGVDAIEDFPSEAEAVAFRDRLIAAYPHLGAQ
jgi:hypothetical protein